MWREVEFFVVNALDFKSGWETEVAVWKGATAEDVDLGLDGDGWAFGDTVEVDAVVVCEEWIVAVGEPACCFFWVETRRS